MNVSQLAHLLDALTAGLDGVLATSHVKDLNAFRIAMQPFADESVLAFATFIGQCEAYRRTGIIAAKPAARVRAVKLPVDPNRIPNAVEAVNALMRQTGGSAVTQQQIDETIQPFNAFLKPELDQVVTLLGIAGRPKTKPDALKKVRQLLESQTRMADSARAIREA